MYQYLHNRAEWSGSLSKLITLQQSRLPSLKWRASESAATEMFRIDLEIMETLNPALFAEVTSYL